MTPPDPQQVAEIAGRLSKAQREIVPRMIDGELVYPLPAIAEELPDTIAAYRRAVKGLRQIGLADHGPLYDEDTGALKGSGSYLTRLGLSVRDFIQGNSHD